VLKWIKDKLGGRRKIRPNTPDTIKMKKLVRAWYCYAIDMIYLVLAGQAIALDLPRPGMT
jgi:hypothetical protein